MAAAAAHRPSTSLTQALCLCGLVLSGSIEAALYRWVDESGTTVYSQSPPPNGQAELIQEGPQGATPEATGAARERLQRTIEADFDRREERKKAAAEKAKREKAEARRKRNCTAARQDLDALKAPGPRRVRYPDGTYRDLTSDEAKEQRDLTQQQVDEFCKPARPAYPPSLDSSPGVAPARPAYPRSPDGLPGAAPARPGIPAIPGR
jgi:hypothetical protein